MLQQFEMPSPWKKAKQATPTSCAHLPTNYKLGAGSQTVLVYMIVDELRPNAHIIFGCLALHQDEQTSTGNSGISSKIYAPANRLVATPNQSEFTFSSMLDLLRMNTPRMIRLAPANHCMDIAPS